MRYVNVPLHEVALFSELVTGNATVGIRPSLPVRDVHMLIGNDLAGPNVLLDLIVTHALSLEPLLNDDLSTNFPEVFPSNVV